MRGPVVGLDPLRELDRTPLGACLVVLGPDLPPQGEELIVVLLPLVHEELDVEERAGLEGLVEELRETVVTIRDLDQSLEHIELRSHDDSCLETTRGHETRDESHQYPQVHLDSLLEAHPKFLFYIEKHGIDVFLLTHRERGMLKRGKGKGGSVSFTHAIGG